MPGYRTDPRREWSTADLACWISLVRRGVQSERTGHVLSRSSKPSALDVDLGLDENAAGWQIIGQIIRLLVPSGHRIVQVHDQVEVLVTESTL